MAAQKENQMILKMHIGLYVLWVVIMLLLWVVLGERRPEYKWQAAIILAFIMATINAAAYWFFVFLFSWL